MLNKLKKWFGFPLATEYQKEIEKILTERLGEINMEENKKAPAKKAPAKKAPAKKSGGSGKPQQAL
ncbi:MAG: hypothetical protein RLZZ195_914 [Pseudomonadota bacterium]